jgi:hypothetical protein
LSAMEQHNNISANVISFFDFQAHQFWLRFCQKTWHVKDTLPKAGLVLVHNSLTGLTLALCIHLSAMEQHNNISANVISFFDFQAHQFWLRFCQKTWHVKDRLPKAGLVLVHNSLTLSL